MSQTDEADVRRYEYVLEGYEGDAIALIPDYTQETVLDPPLEISLDEYAEKATGLLPVAFSNCKTVKCHDGAVSSAGGRNQPGSSHGFGHTSQSACG